MDRGARAGCCGDAGAGGVAVRVARPGPEGVLGPGDSGRAGAAGHCARPLAPGVPHGHPQPTAPAGRIWPRAGVAGGAEERGLRGRRGAVPGCRVDARAAAQPQRHRGGCGHPAGAGAGLCRRQRIQGPQRVVRHLLPLGAHPAHLRPGAPDRGAQRLLQPVRRLPEELLRLQPTRRGVQRCLRRRPAPCRAAPAVHGLVAGAGAGLLSARAGTGVRHRPVRADAVPGGQRVGGCIRAGGGLCACQPVSRGPGLWRGRLVGVLLVCRADHRGHGGGTRGPGAIDLGPATVASHGPRAGSHAGRQRTVRRGALQGHAAHRRRVAARRRAGKDAARRRCFAAPTAGGQAGCRSHRPSIGHQFSGRPGCLAARCHRERRIKDQLRLPRRRLRC